MTTIYTWYFIKKGSVSKGAAKWFDECKQSNFFSKDEVKENILKFMKLHETYDIEYFEIEKYNGVSFSSLNHKMGGFSSTGQSSEIIHKNEIGNY